MVLSTIRSTPFGTPSKSSIALRTEESIVVDTDRVRHAWKGDWNHFNNGASGAVYYTEDSHYVWIPNGTYNMLVQFSPTEVDVETAQVGNLQMEIDLGEDGSKRRSGDKELVFPTHGFTTWMSTPPTGTHGRILTSQAKPWPSLASLKIRSFFEASIPYTVDAVLTIDLSTPVDISIPQRPDFYSDLDPTTPL